MGKAELKIKVDDICMYYQHNFGLLSEKEKDQLRVEATRWLNAFLKTLEDHGLIET